MQRKEPETVYQHFNNRYRKCYTYATRNSKEVAQDLNSIQINNQHKITTLDIKDTNIIKK